MLELYVVSDSLLCYSFLTMKTIQIAPSVLSADFADLRLALESINESGAELVHLDVMDGVFVPNLTFGPKAVEDMRHHSKLAFDVHLMTVNPENLVEGFAKAGADLITFHLEASIHAHRLIQAIKAKGLKAGISIVPSTPVSSLFSLLSIVDLVLVMTVNPGFGGQSIISECVDKVKELDTIRKEKNYGYVISVDGGINEKTAGAVIKNGADILVAGSAFFASKNKKAFVNQIKSL